MDMGPLPIITPKNGSRFVPTIGLDGAVCNSSSDWYDSKSESKAMWPSNGVEGHREWSRRCWFKDLNCGGSPLRREKERGGLIVSDWWIKWCNLVMTFSTLVSMASYWILGGHSATNTTRR